MQQQTEISNCGAAALTNALECLGIKLSQAASAKLASTTHDGTSLRGLRKAIRLLDKIPITVKSYEELVGFLTTGCPVILIVDKDDHYVVAAGVLGERVVIIDSASGSVCFVYNKKDLIERWRGPSKRHPFYGCALAPKSI